jgi:hypothetical protein
MSDKIVEQWWHDNMSSLTAQLSNGVLNEMKRRIETSNIRKEKLSLDENSERMTAFFKAEINRYQKRKDNQKKRQAELEKLDLFKRIIKQLASCVDSPTSLSRSISLSNATNEQLFVAKLALRQSWRARQRQFAGY